MTAPGRCTGHCCRAFPLPYSPEQWAEIAATGAFIHPTQGRIVPQDGRQVADMVISLGFHVHAPPGGIPADPDRVARGEGRHYYTCRHLDRVTGDCGIYETRPRVCSGYPYGRECEHRDCTAPHKGLELPREQLVAIRARTWCMHPNCEREALEGSVACDDPAHG